MTVLKEVVLEYGEELSILAYVLIGDPDIAGRIVLQVLSDLNRSHRLDPEAPYLFPFLCQELRSACKIYRWMQEDEIVNFG